MERDRAEMLKSGHIASDRAKNAHYYKSRIRDFFDALPPYDRRKPSGSTDQNQSRLSKHVTHAHQKLLKDPKNDALKKLTNIHDEFWLVWEDVSVAEPKRVVRRIGHWGQCWALMGLWSLVAADEAPIAPAALANRILAEYKDMLDVSWKHVLEGEKFIDGKGLMSPYPLFEEDKALLTYMLGSGVDASNIPDAKRAAKLLTLVVAFVRQRLAASASFSSAHAMDSQIILSTLKTRDFSNPETCFWGLVEALGIRAAVDRRENDAKSVPQQTGISSVEQGIWTYATSLDNVKTRGIPDEIAEAIRNIRLTIGYLGKAYSDQAPVAILSGPSHAGKKAVIGDFFKQLLARDSNRSNVHLECKEEGTNRSYLLPILCLQTRSRDYYSLCVEVLAFLERVIAQAKGEKIQSQEQDVRERRDRIEKYGGSASIQDLLQYIETLHQNPMAAALFIFLDVRHSANTDIGALIGRQGVRRLIEVLVSSNSGSRFVLTTRKAHDFAELPHHEIRLGPAKIDRIAWYLNDEAERDFQEAVVAFNSSNSARSLLAHKDRSMSGEVLMALAVLFELKIKPPDEFLELMHDAIAKSQPTANSAAILQPLVRTMLQGFADGSLLPYVALIAGSDDGLMENTLHTCADQWRREDPSVPMLDWEQGRAAIEALTLVSRGLFLRRRQPTDFVAEEVRFGEPSYSINPGYFETLAFDATFHEQFRVLLGSDNTWGPIMRQAYRLVGAQARMRAEVRHLRGVPFSRKATLPVSERNIQSYVALLLSLGPTDSPSGSHAGGGNQIDIDRAISMNSLDVNGGAEAAFQIGSNFEPRASLRYARDVLLKREIDRNHQLSMTYDADHLRLQLYVLLCAPPGLTVHWDRERFLSADSRLAVPAELQELELQLHRNDSHLGVFNLVERAEVFTGLGMSAFFTGHLNILKWAEQRLWEIYNKEPVALEGLSRLIAARCDSQALMGRDWVRHHWDSNKPRILHCLKHLRQEMDSLFGTTASETAGRDDLPKSVLTCEARTSAWFRIKLREIDLRRLSYPNFDPRSATLRLLQIEEDAARRWNRHRGFLRNGRSGRLAARLLSADFPIYADKEALPNEVIDFLASVRNANVERLSIYGGSERVFTLIDSARALLASSKELRLRKGGQHEVDQEDKEALDAAIRARRDCLRGSSSDLARLGVLVMESATILTLIERGRLQSDEIYSSINLRLRLEENAVYIKNILKGRQLWAKEEASIYATTLVLQKRFAAIYGEGR